MIALFGRRAWSAGSPTLLPRQPVATRCMGFLHPRSLPPGAVHNIAQIPCDHNPH
ncbi:hypothetical protein OE88DRAFT_1655837 [Heliocybe sulcata]|uniref:Uncharacterized protein n=1 Tax=Heliocybe sulcata TaxID=5364 RepID=A0A5C3N7E6_9AGAM|nr:hypothetical protein OE88DRAFT_1655837 [Heliocybe sulcata]